MINKNSVFIPKSPHLFSFPSLTQSPSTDKQIKSSTGRVHLAGNHIPLSKLQSNGILTEKQTVEINDEFDNYVLGFFFETFKLF